MADRWGTTLGEQVSVPKPLRVDPIELTLKANQIDAQGDDFVTVHRAAHSQASGVKLGAGLSGAALTEMLASWETGDAKFSEQFRTNADDHRNAATAYLTTDGRAAHQLGDADAAP